jgi:hypothetical protein
MSDARAVRAFYQTGPLHGGRERRYMEETRFARGEQDIPIHQQRLNV